MQFSRWEQTQRTTLASVQGMWVLDLSFLSGDFIVPPGPGGYGEKRWKDFKSNQCLPGTTAMISMRTVVAAGIGPAQVPADRAPH